jgi:hypothetical protein
MSAAAERDVSLYGTEGFVLESPEGDLGWIEEVLIGDEEVPVALAVRTIEGWHGLLRREEVLAVDREYHWVVVPREPSLLELESPHLVAAEGDAGGVVASWTTTGAVRHPQPRRPRSFPLPFRGLRRRWARGTTDPRLWKAIAVELTFIALLVLLVVGLAFLVARLVTGAAY